MVGASGSGGIYTGSPPDSGLVGPYFTLQPMKMEPIEGSETSAIINQTPGNYYFIIIIGIQPLGRSGQRPELSQVTGMALVRCILGKFLGVVCHCFPPLF